MKKRKLLFDNGESDFVTKMEFPISIMRYKNKEFAKKEIDDYFQSSSANKKWRDQRFGKDTTYIIDNDSRSVSIDFRYKNLFISCHVSDFSKIDPVFPKRV
jgi:hypothetical protein